MTTPRPIYRATWAASGGRTLPPGGTAVTGYGFGAVPTHGDWNHQQGYLADTIAAVDNTAMRSADMSDATQVVRLTPDSLLFTVGGPLAQRPVNGGVYMIGAERVCAEDVDPITAPVYTFTANTTNYVWLRTPLSTSVLAYADRAITQVLVSPGAGFAHVRTVVCGPAVVISDTEPGTVSTRHKWAARPHDFTDAATITPQGTATTLTVNQALNSAEGLLVTPLTVGVVTAGIRVVTNTNSLAALDHTLALGSGTTIAPTVKSTLGNNGSGLLAVATGGAASGGASVVSRMAGKGYDLAMLPGGTPVAGAALAGHLRMWADVSALGGGLRWLDAAAGDIRLPFCGRDGLISVNGGFGSATGAIAQGATNQTLATIIAFQWRQNHTYIIWVGAEPVSGATAANFTVTLAAPTVNGVAITGTQFPALLGSVAAPSPAGAILPVIREFFVYTHTAADVSANLLIRVTHGAGTVGSTITYNNVRVIMVGGFR